MEQGFLQIYNSPFYTTLGRADLCVGKIDSLKHEQFLQVKMCPIHCDTEIANEASRDQDIPEKLIA